MKYKNHHVHIIAIYGLPDRGASYDAYICTYLHIQLCCPCYTQSLKDACYRIGCEHAASICHIYNNAMYIRITSAHVQCMCEAAPVLFEVQAFKH